ASSPRRSTGGADGVRRLRAFTRATSSGKWNGFGRESSPPQVRPPTPASGAPAPGSTQIPPPPRRPPRPAQTPPPCTPRTAPGPPGQAARAHDGALGTQPGFVRPGRAVAGPVPGVPWAPRARGDGRAPPLFLLPAQHAHAPIMLDHVKHADNTTAWGAGSDRR